MENSQLFHENFPSVSREIWMEKILSDLKGKSVESLFWTIDGLGIFDPFVHPHNTVETFSFPKKSKNFRPTLAALKFPFGESDVLDLLRMGFESILLENIDEGFDLESVLDEVDFSLVDVYIRNRSSANKNIVSLTSQEVLNLSLPIDRLAKQFTNHVLEEFDPSSKEAHCFELVLGENLLLNIAICRAFRQVFYQYMNDTESKRELRTIAYYLTDSEGDLAQSLLEATPQCLAALIGGCDHVLPSSNTPLDLEKLRLHMNVLHILKMEGGIDQSKDAVAGSILLEKLSNAIVDEFRNDLKIATR